MNFKKVFISATIASSLAVTTIGNSQCAWFKSNSAQVTTDVGKILSCVLSQLFSGNSNPTAIATSCIGTTVAMIDEIIISLINFYDQPVISDAGPAMAASDKRCGNINTAPYKGIPICITQDQLANFKVMHTQLSAQMAAH